MVNETMVISIATMMVLMITKTIVPRQRILIKKIQIATVREMPVIPMMTMTESLTVRIIVPRQRILIKKTQTKIALGMLVMNGVVMDGV